MKEYYILLLVGSHTAFKIKANNAEKAVEIVKDRLNWTGNIYGYIEIVEVREKNERYCKM